MIVDDLDKMYGDAGLRNVRELIGRMNQNGDFFRPDLCSSVSEHEQHGIDNVALSTTVGSDYRSETLKLINTTVIGIE